ncbi:MAG: hypothetical protein PHS33_08735, partial [Candidatus Omnitrophica bacterium]|nr:hypothetical protein [Candidatus Omnitrophota bacterium]
MVKDDKNLKTDPSGQSDTEAVNQDPIDVNAPITLEQAQQAMEAEEGNIEASITKEKIEKDKALAPDLQELKKEQLKKKQEIKEAKEEITEEIEAETPEEPSKFAGKSETERLKIYKDMEAGYTKLSQKAKELEQKIKDLEVVNAKIEEYEKNAIISEQKTIQSKLPEYPPDELYYEDPIKYNKQIKAYNDAVLNAAISPIYGQTYSYEKNKVINNLKERTKGKIIPYSEVETEVETRLKQNPALFDQHKLKAREVMYNEIVAERLPEKIEEIEKKAVEKARKESQEEEQDLSNSQVMSSDITTQRRESKPVDFEEQLNSGVDPQKIKEAIKKKYR